MRTTKIKGNWLAVFIFLLSALPVFAVPPSGNDQEPEPAALFLTWQQDPTTTMTIDWHTESGDGTESILYYRKEGSGEWVTTSASQVDFPYSDRIIHRVEVTRLEPATYYQFRVGEFERIYKFRTIPKTNHRPLRFAAGGDTSIGEEFKKTNRIAMSYDPDFIVWGGDLAYADAEEGSLERWYTWFERIREDLISEEGRVIPIVLTIGNHELTNHHYPYAESTMKEMGTWLEFIEQVKKGEFDESTRQWREENAPYYYKLFAFPGHPGYGVLDFGNYLSLISLDSSHSNLISGDQTEWLKEVLRSRQDVPHLIPFYHKPAYPSNRVEPSAVPTQFWARQVLDNWVPLFEQYGVKVALENDDHTYKRTYPILKDKVDPAGIVYIGDGAWGVDKKDPKTAEEIWYLNRSAGENHAIIVTLQGAHQHFLIVNNDGKIIDEYPQTPTGE